MSRVSAAARIFGANVTASKETLQAKRSTYDAAKKLGTCTILCLTSITTEVVNANVSDDKPANYIIAAVGGAVFAFGAAGIRDNLGVLNEHVAEYIENTTDDIARAEPRRGDIPQP